jgi:ketosteroid isomerase-like protein
VTEPSRRSRPCSAGRASVEVIEIALFDWPTRLPGDVVGRLETFAQSFLVDVPTGDRSRFLEKVRDCGRPVLCDEEGCWTADHVRLRFSARKRRRSSRGVHVPSLLPRSWQLCFAHVISEHPNARRIVDLFSAFRGGDVGRVADILDENVAWRFPGKSGRLAGEHRGRDAVFAFLVDVTQLTEGTFHLELESVIADEDHAVAFFRGHGRRHGKVLDNPTCLKIRLEKGKVVDVWEFVWDLYHVDEFWS